MRAGTGEQSVFEHVDSRAELLPEGGSPQGIHLNASYMLIMIDYSNPFSMALAKPVTRREEKREGRSLALRRCQTSEAAVLMVPSNTPASLVWMFLPAPTYYSTIARLIS